ncbi:MAG: hypothetical protein ACREJB_00275 [Planctomycetaceae bacterium]
MMRLLQWLLASSIVVTALAIAAAHVPGRFRLLGLFAVVFGLLCGRALAYLSRMLNLKRSRLVLLIAGLLIAAAEVGMTLESYRQFVAENERQLDAELRRQNVPAALLPALRRDFLAERTSLSAYLTHRVSELGDWPMPWPAVLWSVEALLGVAAGTWLFALQTRAR